MREAGPTDHFIRRASLLGVAARRALNRAVARVRPHWCGATRELECEQRCSHDFGRKAAARGERIDSDGRVAERGDHGAFIGGEIVVRRCCCRGARARDARQSQFVEDVLRGFDELCALAQELVATFGKR